MKHKLLIATAAAALLTGTTFVSAQDKAPAPPAASERGPMKSESRQPAAQGRNGGQATPGQNAQRPDGDRPGMMRGKQAQDGAPDRGAPQKGATNPRGGDKDRSAQGRDGRPDRDRSPAAERRDNRPDNDRNRAADSRRGPGNISPEQRSKMRQSFRQHRNAPRVNSVNFNISIGTAIPARVRLAPVPVQVVEYYPRWRGYRFFIAGDEIVIVHPRTLEIVAVLPA